MLKCRMKIMSSDSDSANGEPVVRSPCVLASREIATVPSCWAQNAALLLTRTLIIMRVCEVGMGSEQTTSLRSIQQAHERALLDVDFWIVPMHQTGTSRFYCAMSPGIDASVHCAKPDFQSLEQATTFRMSPLTYRATQTTQSGGLP